MQKYGDRAYSIAPRLGRNAQKITLGPTRVWKISDLNVDIVHIISSHITPRTNNLNNNIESNQKLN